MKNLSRQSKPSLSPWALILIQSCLLLFVLASSPSFWGANQAETLSAAKKAVMADIEQMKKIVPLITCEMTFGLYVCELMFGVDVFDLDLGVQIDSIKQPIKSNSVGSGNMSHCVTPAFDYHLNHGFIVLKDIQHSIGTRMCSA